MQSRRLYRELVKENEKLQERRKMVAAQHLAEEAAASAWAAKLYEREEMIRKRKEEIRTSLLQRSERLREQGAKMIATALVSTRMALLSCLFLGCEGVYSKQSSVLPCQKPYKNVYTPCSRV